MVVKQKNLVLSLDRVVCRFNHLGHVVARELPPELYIGALRWQACLDKGLPHFRGLLGALRVAV